MSNSKLCAHEACVMWCPDCGIPPMLWIACKDRLPRERGAYLVYEESWPEQVRCCNYGTSQKWDNGRDKLRRKVGRGITHWMPLPEPPRD